jgi:Plant transposon protein
MEYTRGANNLKSYSSGTENICSGTRSSAKVHLVCIRCLFARFHILCTPSCPWTTDETGDILTACATMHNMIVAVRKYEYTGDGACGSYQESADQRGEVFSGLLDDLNIGEQNYVVQSLLQSTASEDSKNISQHNYLVSVLVQHVSEIE